MFSHRAISTRRSRWWCLCVCVCVCVCVRDAQLVVGAQLLLSVNTFHLHAIHTLESVLLHFPGLHADGCFVLFNIMKSWFRCEQVSKGLFCFTNNTVNNQHNLSYMHLAVNVPSNFISCWAKLLYWADILATWAKTFLIQDLYSTHKKLWTCNYIVLFIFDLTLD